MGKHVESLSRLFEVMGTIEEKQRVDIRLKLRQELRRLIARIDVYAGGSPLLTSEISQKALSAVLDTFPDVKDTPAFRRLKEDVQKKVENPKDFLTLKIHFTTGSIRWIRPRQEPVLTLDFDKEKGIVRNWVIGPEVRLFF